MNHIIRGHLQGNLCEGFSEPLAGMQVRLYRPGPGAARRASGDPLQYLFFLQSDLAVRQKESRLISETRTDAQGRFVFQFENETVTYAGDAVEIDVRCHHVPHQPVTHSAPFEPVQFTITVLDPFWRATESGLTAAWDCMIPSWFWCAIRARFNARVICGRVASRDTGNPMCGVRVRVAVPDPGDQGHLGAAVTDADGGFRIDFPSHGARALSLPAWLNQDRMTGQVFSFQVETADGHPLLTDTVDPECVTTASSVSACLRVELMPETEMYESMLPPVRTVMHLANSSRDSSAPMSPMSDPTHLALLSLSFP